MRAFGIITEYNPLHRGHVYFMDTIRRSHEDCAIVCAMSGDFVQRGDFALLRRHARAEAAVRCGADLVLELPLPWAVSSAEAFAAGGVETLLATGVVDTIAFGSECGDSRGLMRIAQALLDERFPALLKAELTKGDSFAAARQRAVAALTGAEDAALLAQPNNTLGIEYCKAVLAQGRGSEIFTIPRVGSAHDSQSLSAYPSASAIRTLLQDGRRPEALDAMSLPMKEIYLREEAAGRAPVFRRNCQQAILARLRTMDASDFARLDEGGEGLGNRLFKASRTLPDVDAILEQAKTKRYPMARLRRMVLWAYLGLEPGARPAHPLYLRVLACNERGRSLLAQMRTSAALPVITKPADVRALGSESVSLFEQEVRAAGLYALAYPELSAAEGGRLWTEGPVIL